MTFRANVRGEWLGARAFPYTLRAREGPGEECPSREVVYDQADVFVFSQSSFSTSLCVVVPFPQYKPNRPLEYIVQLPFLVAQQEGSPFS